MHYTKGVCPCELVLVLQYIAKILNLMIFSFAPLCSQVSYIFIDEFSLFISYGCIIKFCA